MHVSKAERVERWRASARADCDLAAEIVERFPHLVCYHAQQAIEKSLQTVITAISGDAIPTHLGRILLRALSDLGVVVSAEIGAVVLAADSYYLPTRYPDALDFADAADAFGPTEASAAVADADAVIVWADAIARNVA